MRLIGVIDLASGLAVHARQGHRAHYVPVEVVAGREIRGNPLTLARTYTEQFGLTELYAADLDAIAVAVPLEMPRDASAGRPAHVGHDTILAGLGAVAPLWLDAAISTPGHALHALNLGARQVVVGLETLPSFDALSAVCSAVGRERVAFSLDLRGNAPIAPVLDRPSDEPAELAARASDAGVGSVIVIDLQRVGTATGPDTDLMARVRAAAPGATLIAGGGIRGLEDLARLVDAGCDGALVATALHDGRLNAAHLP